MEKAMRKTILAAIIMLLAGCASQIMGGFVGKPVTTVISQYGFPAGAYDVEKNKRAFVWQMNKGVVIPGSSFTSGTVIGNQMFANTYTSPGYATSSTCVYVLYAEKTRNDIEGPAAWTIVGFEKPKMLCE
jgi:hypothetical protein